MTQAIARKSLYESDFLLWTQDTVAKLKARDFDHVDLENLIEEIDSLGRSDKKEIKSRLTTLLAHLLKRIYIDMPDCFNGWENTIVEQRTEIEFAFADSPSLKTLWNDTFDIAFRTALRNVKKEYAKKGYQIPDTWQFGRDIDTMLNVDFWE
ncbi:DUF29 domain-containing protein [Pseudanabaena sp. FACHB-1998]|uniref:DUF29 domain-containing protein n=1 Tax=Pseudanabaena sp. FACHB-1998 TaxID=2692858 RepID=UPI0016810078|nr:DUF29 domain-containing protein [Pseudanabaena sp. FACHB-1998]MBD2175464.1 DUF29 domain-containing protein [Pseudanabaena sp. FACHB-1998]